MGAIQGSAIEGIEIRTEIGLAVVTVGRRKTVGGVTFIRSLTTFAVGFWEWNEKSLLS